MKLKQNFENIKLPVAFRRKTYPYGGRSQATFKCFWSSDKSESASLQNIP